MYNYSSFLYAAQLQILQKLTSRSQIYRSANSKVTKMQSFLMKTDKQIFTVNFLPFSKVWTVSAADYFKCAFVAFMSLLSQFVHISVNSSFLYSGSSLFKVLLCLFEADFVNLICWIYFWTGSFSFGPLCVSLL